LLFSTQPTKLPSRAINVAEALHPHTAVSLQTFGDIYGFGWINDRRIWVSSPNGVQVQVPLDDDAAPTLLAEDPSTVQGATSNGDRLAWVDDSSSGSAVRVTTFRR
jgi:hypothetical protein